MSKPELAADEPMRRELRRRTRRGFAGALAALGAGAAGWAWFVNSPKDGRINLALRRALELHERLGRATFRNSSRAAEFPVSQATMPIVNGNIGLYSSLDPEDWRFRVIGAGGEAAAKDYALADLRRFPRVEMVTELRCVEGWSTVVRWSGVRFRDFAEATGLLRRARRSGDPFEYAGLETPDGGYLVGLDMQSALHPQTLLCDTMDGAPLRPEHGAPLRLVIPVKYGYKSLKRIGVIRFSDERPFDSWASQGFDWYAGL